MNCTNSPGHTAAFNVRYYGPCNYMDLNNNLVGRTYMYNTVGQTWLGNAYNIPSWATIYSYVNGLSSTQKTCSSASDINSSFTMDNIGHYLNAFDYNSSATLVNIIP